MSANQITWEQFSVCNNDSRGIQYRLEDLCRQLFAYEFLAGNKEKIYLHSNPNNAGLESEPIYDEKNNRWIGYQVKYFENKINYSQIQHSAEEIVKYYKGKVDYVYIFCNKSITATCPGYKKVTTILNSAGILSELITDTTILDLVRKYPNLGMYYFEQHMLSQKWFENHTKDIYAKIGERYNCNFNVDTKNALKVSLFVQDKDAVVYINEKKNKLIKRLETLNWRYDSFSEYVQALKKTVKTIPDVTSKSIIDSEKWGEIVYIAIKEKLSIFNIKIEKLEQKLNALYTKFQGKRDNEKKEIWEKITKTREELEIYNTLINLSKALDISTEMQLIKSNILILEGNAGAGKTHLLANEVDKLISNKQKVLMLIGGDYLENRTITEQIMSELSLNYSFYEMLEILNTEGENEQCIIPVIIDAINETWNKVLWKSSLPVLFNKVRSLKYIKLIISFRSEYQKALIEENELQKEGIYKIEHRGFAEESFVATKKFFDYYGIPFSPVHMFNQSINNPLFLTLYCKTYQGDEVELPVLYERLLNVANTNVHKNMAQALLVAGYDSSDDVVTPVILALADYINLTGKKYFSKNEISDMSIWKINGINLRPFIQNMVRENILHEYMYKDEERIYFAYDQMNDYFCAKALLSQFSTKREIKIHVKEKVLEIQNERAINYQNQEFFIYICALYAEKYNEECIEIIDDIQDANIRENIFNRYIDSLQWRKNCNITVDYFIILCNKYNIQPEKVWTMFIANSIKQQNIFNADALHNILFSYELNKRDYLWTIFINSMEYDEENRLVQIVQLYSEGNGLELINDKQTELLLTLFGWVLTSSSRWLRDYTSKAMVEILKYNFSMSEMVLKKFEKVNDPYIIQRLYGIVWGACVKRKNKDRTIDASLAKYVYETIFCNDEVYPDILLRDYARLIIERYLYEYPDENVIDISKIMPPYRSEPIPNIINYEYSKKDYEKGMFQIVHSMQFEGSGWYGDFGRYVYESALKSFDVDHEEIFNYSVYYIFNYLGYNNELFGEYDSNVERFNYQRHNVAKLERIGKKYQWITMYNVLARVADHCNKRDEYSQTKSVSKYEGPWDPYVRDFDASLNEKFMADKELPVFEQMIQEQQLFKKENDKILNSEKEEISWIKEYPDFFESEKTRAILKDSKGVEWITLVKYADTKNSTKDKLQIWNWLYGYFVTKEQFKILKEYASKNEKLLNGDITWIPETYTTYCREYPWSVGCQDIKQSVYTSMNLKTGEKKTVTETYSVPDFSEIDLLLEKYTSNDKESDTKEQNEPFPKFEISMKEKKVSREIEIEKNIGKIMCAAVNFMWEEEFDASKKETISWYVPCAELIEKMNLQYGECDGAFYDTMNNVVAFDTAVAGYDLGLVVRKDVFDTFLRKNQYCFVWFVNASKEIHKKDLSIRRYSDWAGLYYYENNKVMGDIFICEN